MAAPQAGRSSRTETDRITALLLAVVAAILLAVLVLAKDRLTGTLAVLAASGGGALLGLLFAIPKRITVPEDQAAPAKRPKGALLVANTSLEEVSDWLTKTIVGVGLVSWASVLAVLDRAGLEVGKAVIGPSDGALACGVAIIVASAIHGGMSAYLWFSRHLPGEFDAAFRGVRDAQGLQQQGAAVAPVAPTAAPAAASLAGVDAPAAAEGALLQTAVATKYARMREAPLDIEDWAAGLFGGDASVENKFGKRTLTAKVTKVASGLYQVNLSVKAEPVPATPCVFFLHNTFPNSTPSVGFDANGEASLSVTAYGAFTVGVITDDGSTELELNLARLPGVPREFRDG